MCPRLSHLELSEMDGLNEAGRISMASLLRQIIQNNPPIATLNMSVFSGSEEIYENLGEIILETLLNDNFDSITDLNLM